MMDGIFIFQARHNAVEFCRNGRKYVVPPELKTLCQQKLASL